jgi:hypothetical protein
MAADRPPAEFTNLEEAAGMPAARNSMRKTGESEQSGPPANCALGQRIC